MRRMRKSALVNICTEIQVLSIYSFDAASYNTRLSRIEAFEAGTVKGT